MIKLQETKKVLYKRGPHPELHSSVAQVKAIGVSNFTIAQLQGIIDATGVVPVRFQVLSSLMLS